MGAHGPASFFAARRFVHAAYLHAAYPALSGMISGPGLALVRRSIMRTVSYPVWRSSREIQVLARPMEERSAAGAHGEAVHLALELGRCLAPARLERTVSRAADRSPCYRPVERGPR